MDTQFRLISFDETPDAAEIERQEDRNLNVILRQSRIRSEMYRLPVVPGEAQSDFLCEILRDMPARPLIILARGISERPAQQAAFRKIVELGMPIHLVSIGDDTLPDDIAVEAVTVRRGISDTAATMRELAEYFTRLPGAP